MPLRPKPVCSPPFPRLTARRPDTSEAPASDWRSCNNSCSSWGGIGITSAPGQGSTFWFTVQLGCATPRDNPLPTHNRFLSVLRVLVVDDNATNRFILNSQLTSWGAESVDVDTGAAALVLLTQAASERTPSVWPFSTFTCLKWMASCSPKPLSPIRSSAASP